MQTDTTGIEATELEGRERHRALVEHFGHIDPATEPAPLLELIPTEHDRWKQALSARATLRVDLEPARIAADLEINRRKNSGELLRREIDHAHLQELQAGVHS